MIVPKRILISSKVEEALKEKGIYKQFLKSKDNVLGGLILGGTQLRKREPKKDDMRYFRINKQYRAIGELDVAGNFWILSLDDHQ